MIRPNNNVAEKPDTPIITSLLYSTLMERAIICQRFITDDQRLRLSQQSDMICGESKQNHWSVILQPHPYHQCWQERSSFPLMPKVALFLSFFASPGPVNSKTTAVNSFFLFPQSLRIFFCHAPSFFARLSVFSSFLEKKYCTLWRY